MRQTGPNELLGDDNTIGDKGYIGAGITTPYRKPAGGELLDWQKEFNTSIDKIRYVIERTIAHFKTWQCMHTDYLRPERIYATAFTPSEHSTSSNCVSHKPQGNEQVVLVAGGAAAPSERRPG
jgi:hypothetical protein